MQLLIHTLRALNYIVRENLLDESIESFPDDVCPDGHFAEVLEQLEQLEFCLPGEGAVGGTSIQLDGRKRGAVERAARQYRAAEIEWQVLRSTSERPDSADTYDGIIGLVLNDEPVSEREANDAAHRLQSAGLVEGMATLSGLLIRPTLEPRGRHLFSNDLTTVVLGSPEASTGSIDRSIHTNISAGRDAVGIASGAGNLVEVVQLSEGPWSRPLADLREYIEDGRSHLGGDTDELLTRIQHAEELAPASRVAARALVQTVRDHGAEFAGTAFGSGLIALATQAMTALGG